MAEYDDDATETEEFDDEAAERGASGPWLDLIREAEKTFRNYDKRAASVDRIYADLERLSTDSRDREFQLFWANCEVLKPSIYARPPIPVVVPKFKDRRAVPRIASELLERATITAFDLSAIDDVMMLLRDDLAITARGVAWVRYDTTQEGQPEKVCIEHVHRSDFLHDPARNWAEVGWVARRVWLTREEVEERFDLDDDEINAIGFGSNRKAKEVGADDGQDKAEIWELWSRDERKVVWVTKGAEKVLDEGLPHLELEGFFPCPKPAYGTVQRGSLIPVPDMAQYKDQLEEINQLTNRIHSLSQGLRMRGFYQAGGDIGAAVEMALKSTDDAQIMIPVPNMAAIGPGNAPFVMLPIAEVAQTVAGLIEMRRSVIDDVYQIMGLSDIMRGSSQASETATAQNIKAQYGSVRIRDKQTELVRIARDLVRISAEIMAENFDRKTLLDMSQMEIPTQAEIAKQKREIEAQQAAIADKLAEIQNNPEAMAQAEQDPEQAQQMLAQAQGEIEQLAKQIAKLDAVPTIEAVMKLLRDQRLRPFTLDIETDSTIQPDEDAEKQRRTEFMTAFMTASQALGQMIAANPATAPLAGEMLKFVLAPFRAGRAMEGAIEDFVAMMSEQADNPPPNPAAQAMQAKAAEEQKKLEAELQKMKMQGQLDAQAAQLDSDIKQAEMIAKGQADAQRIDAEARLADARAAQATAESLARIEQISAQTAAAERKAALDERKLLLEIELSNAAAAAKAAQEAMTREAANG